MLSEQREGLLNVVLPQFRAIAAHNHNFLVAESRQGFDCIFQPLTERASLLKVHANGG